MTGSCLSWSTCARGANKPGLGELLGQFDAFLLAGGNPYYLRSLMRITGADELITERVRDGAIYAGASAAAVVAGPTLRHFDELDSPDKAEEVIWIGLGLTQQSWRSVRRRGPYGPAPD